MFAVSNLGQINGGQGEKSFTVQFGHNSTFTKAFVAATEMRGPSFNRIVCLCVC